MKKILYIVATQYDNMGDLLINKCLIDELAEYGEVYLDTKNVPESFKAVLLEHKNARELSEVSTLSLKGKGLLLLPFYRNFKFDYMFKSPGPFGGSVTFGQKVKASLFQFIFSVMKQRGTKSYLIGNDFVLASDFDKKIVRKYGKVLDGLYVRSKENVTLLKGLGVPDADYSPDLCFMMKADASAAQKQRVGISFRDMGDATNQKIKKAVKLYIDYFSSKNVPIEIFYQVERDKQFNLELFNEFRNDLVTFREKVLAWEERDYYLDKGVLISNRLHVLLLGQIYESLPVALLYGQANTKKIKDLYDTVGMPDFVFSDVTTADLDKIYDNRDILRARIKEVNNKQKSIFKSHLEKIFNGRLS